MKRRLGMLMVAPLFLAAMCEDDDDVMVVPCTTDIKPAMVVYLYDQAQTPIPAVGQVVAIDGEESFSLTYNALSNNYQGPPERAGTYVLRVNVDGYVEEISEPIHITANECHVNTQTLDITLDTE